MDQLEFKAALTVDEAGTITGTAWPFGSADRVGDLITKGAFTSPATLPMLFGHDQNQPIGIWDSITETSDGLTVKGRLLIDDVARAREVRALVREGAVTGLSIGFVTKKSQARRGGGRTISALDLHEISIVPIPSHPGARIITAKSAETGGRMPETETAAAPDFAAFETKLADIAGEVKGFNKLTDRLDRMEAKLNRPGIGASAANDNEAKIETKALNGFLRGGVNSLDDIERKTLNLGTTTAGGYIVAPEYSTTIIEKLTQFSPLRALASVMTIGGTEIYIPTLTDNIAGGWVTETGPRPSTEPVFGQANIKVYEYGAIVPVSQQLLEDSFIDLSAFLSGHISKQFGKSEASAFMVGDGNGKPTGLLHTPADYSQVTADQDGSDIIAKLIEAFYKLPGSYAAQGSWLMRRETMGLIRAAADTATKGNLWSDSLANGTPATLLGRPVYESVDMNLVGDGTTAAPTYPVAFGDYASAYQIVDRVGVAIQKDDFTGADNGIVKLRARRRVGGKPMLTEAVVLIKAA